MMWRFQAWRRLVYWAWHVTHWRKVREASETWRRLSRDQQVAVVQAVIEGRRV